MPNVLPHIFHEVQVSHDWVMKGNLKWRNTDVLAA
jgi:hypothetical protein